MNRRIKIACVLGAWMILAAIPQSAMACAACSGRSDDAMAQGLNAGVLTLLTVLVVLLSVFAGFAIYLVGRASRYPLALPGRMEGVVGK